MGSRPYERDVETMTERGETSLGCCNHGSFPEVFHAARHCARVPHFFLQHRRHLVSLLDTVTAPRAEDDLVVAIVGSLAPSV